MKFTAKIFWPDCLEIITETSFEALGTAVGRHLENAYRLAPVQIQFAMDMEPAQRKAAAKLVEQ